MRRNAPGMPMYASNAMFELCRLLDLHMQAAPMTQGKDIVRISAGCEFEGFGRASESWDIVWTLTLCRVRRYVRMASGWQAANYPDPMTFRGRDDADCIKQAIQFLRDVPKPQALTLHVPPTAATIGANALDDDAAENSEQRK